MRPVDPGNFSQKLTNTQGQRVVAQRVSPVSSPRGAAVRPLHAKPSVGATETITMVAADALSAVEVLQSPNDKKKYHYFQLPNRLRVLLVSDPECVAEEAASEDEYSDEGLEDDELDSDDEADDDEEGGDEGSDEGDERPMKKAAAAIAVGTGSFSDPVEVQGLSHYLEHMLFMGSEKYTDENEYDAWLTKNGGMSNAYTELEYTNFHFDCNPNVLAGALDRFAQFFIAPLCKADSMEREVQAVDSEFTGVLQSDSCRLSQLICHTAKDDHIYRKFSWGNRKSLVENPEAAGVDVRAKLLDYYKTNYRAERSTLVVLGGEDIPELKRMVTQTFSALPTDGTEPPSYRNEGMPFAGAALYVLPAVKEKHTVSVTFQLPPTKSEYASKPTDYLGHLIGHEGPGSLLSGLKARGWATDLYAGVDEDGYAQNDAVTLFSVVITLTDAGLAAGPGMGLAPLGLVFSFIALLAKEGPCEWVFAEMKAIADMKFRFAEEYDAMDYVTTLASNMQFYTPEHVLAGGFLHEKWKPELIASLLDCMSPEKDFRVDLQTSDYDSLKELAEGMGGKEGNEPWFNMKYVQAPIPAEVLAGWRSIEPEADLSLPPPNPYITTNFDLHSPEPVQSDAANAEGTDASAIITPPTLLVEAPGLRIWHKLDETHRTPRANAYFKLTSPTMYSTPREAAVVHLLLKVLEDALNEDAYHADLAGLHVNLYQEGALGIEIQVDGFNEKLPLLVANTLRGLRDLKPNEQTFPAIKEALVRRYKNMNIQVGRQGNYLRLYAIRDSVHHCDAVLEELQKLEAADVEAHVPKVLESLCVEALLHGNAREEDAHALAATVTEICAPSGSLAARARDRTMRLGEGITYVHAVRAKNPDDENCVCENYYQAGMENARDLAIADLVEQIVGEPCYDTLRTKEQLGYTVYSGMRLTHGVLGFAVTVVSGAHPADHLDDRIEAFLGAQDKALKKLPRAEFEEHRAALILRKLQPCHNLGEETDRHWGAIHPEAYQFHRRAEEVGELRKLTLKDVHKWFSKHVSPASATRRKLSIQVYGKNSLAQLESHAEAAKHKDVEQRRVLISCLDAFKASLDKCPAKVVDPTVTNKTGKRTGK